MLSSNSSTPWSSLASNGSNAYEWSVNFSSWAPSNRDFSYGVVVSLAFGAPQPKNPESIVKTVDNIKTVFLPAYNGNTPPCNFYVKNYDGSYSILKDGESNITDMASLASAIANIDPDQSDPKVNAEKVYVENKEGIQGSATGLTFYGTLNRSWNNTFKKSPVQSGLAEGLNDAFKEILNSAGLKTVYFTHNDDTTPTAEGHWSATEQERADNICPTINGVDYGRYQDSEYTGFYGAYKNYLSSNASGVLSSRASNIVNACR